MNSTERTLPKEVRRILDGHLDAIDRVLARSATPREERRAICDEVENQACEMLWQRTPGLPTEKDLRAVLTEMDVPESYGKHIAEATGIDQGSEGISRRIHRYALVAFLIPILTVFNVMIPTPFHPGGEVPTYIFVGIMTALSIVFCCLALGEIRRQPRRYSGVGFSTFGIVALPIVVLFTLSVLFVDSYDPIGAKIAPTIHQHRVRINAQLTAVRAQQLKLQQEQPAEQEKLRAKSLHSKRLEFLEADLQRLGPEAENEAWLAEHSYLLEVLKNILGDGLVFAFLLGISIWLYRRLRRFCHQGVTADA